jgi:hypothetical protein
MRPAKANQLANKCTMEMCLRRQKQALDELEISKLEQLLWQMNLRFFL